MTEQEIDRRLALYLAETRTSAKITQNDMAKKMGVSRRTIQSWELGESYPKVSTIIKWVYITKHNPIRILQEICAPVFDRIKGSDSDARIEGALVQRITSLRVPEKRALLYILFGNHGSSVYAFLQLAIAYLQCPMGDRQSIALSVINNYKNAERMGTIRSPENIQPNIDVLENALEKAREAYLNGHDSYINIDLQDAVLEEEESPAPHVVNGL